MTTARDLCQGSLEAAKVYAPGEQINDADIARVFLLLNQMLDSWSNESLTCFAFLQQNFPLVVGQTAYTIGQSVSADINGPRPIRIVDGPGAAYLKDSNDNRYPVTVVPKDKWNEIWNIRLSTSDLPDTIYYDPQFPLATINVYPKYSGGMAVSLYFDSLLQLVSFPSLTTAVSLPPGYERAIQTNLAIEVEPYFPTAAISSALARSAAQSKGNVKRSNSRENIAEFDQILTSRSQPGYNIYSDSYR